jgi:DNA-binding PucR family transcriptional regulator
MRVLARREKGTTVASLDDVRSEAILLELLDLLVGREDLRAGKTATAIAHDREHGTQYAATLRAYLDAFGNIPAAARRAGVHPNTFRYRLRRLIELAGLRLEDPEERIVAALQLRMQDR